MNNFINTLINGDCLIAMKDIPDGSVDLIVTDPPYIVTTGGGGVVNKILKLEDSLKDLDRAKITEGYDIESFSKEVQRLCKNGINAYFWCNKLQIPEYFRVYVGLLNCKFDILCWHKRNALPTYHNKYLTDTEYCLYFRNGKSFANPKNYEDAQTYSVGVINLEDKRLYGHPTCKPLDWMRKLIRNSSSEGQTILDPFCGSGTTCIAALRENRKYIGIELDQHYYEVAKKRIENELSQPKLF